VSALGRLRSFDPHRGAWEPWRRGLVRWLPALVLLVLTAGLFVVYQERFAGRAEVSAQALNGGHQELTRLRAEHRRIEGELALVSANRQHLEEFYARLATERARLTKVIAEVKELARRSGLDPQSISYPEQALADSGLRKRSFVFGVEGTYPNLRKLVNLLELSDSFLTLERVDLTGGGDRGAQLRIDLRLSTLFVTPPAPGTARAGDDESPPATPAGPSPPAPAAPGGESEVGQ
jgi:hypothetical protein